MTVLQMFYSPSVDDASYLGSFALASIHSRGVFIGGGPAFRRCWSSQKGHNVRFGLIGKPVTLGRVLMYDVWQKFVRWLSFLAESVQSVALADGPRRLCRSRAREEASDMMPRVDHQHRIHEGLASGGSSAASHPYS